MNCSYIIQFYSDNNYWLSVIVPILTAGLGYCANRLLRDIKRYKLKKMLGLLEVPSELAIPIRTGAIEGASCRTDEFVTFQEALVIAEIKENLRELGGKYDSMEILKKGQSADLTKNIFYFGGHVVHDYVRRTLLIDFPMIRFSCKKSSYDKLSDDFKKLNKPIHDDNDPKRFIYINDEVQLDYNKDTEGFFIWIRLTGKNDFSNPDHGTVHIFYGIDAIVSLSIAKCYNDCRNTLYKLLKQHNKSHYCLIGKHKNGEIDFKSVKDVTKSVFI